MIDAIEEAVVALLTSNSAFDDVRLFIRGGAPLVLASDRYPFCEVIIGQETQTAEYSGPSQSGGLQICTYHGLVSFSVNLQSQGQADWLRVMPGTRVARVGSYDLVKQLVMAAQLEFQRHINHSLNDLQVAYAQGSQTVAEVVQLFALNGALIYGMEQRQNNYSNFGSVPFLAETRRIITETGG